MTLPELANVLPDRLERWCERQERGLGRFGTGLLLAVLFLLAACIYVTPELHPVFSGKDYAQYSKNPFDWKTPGGLRSRLLTPLIGWAVGLRGERFIVLPVLFGLAFLIAVYLTARSRFGWSPAESCAATAVVAFSTPILSTLRFPGYVDTTTDLLILLAFLTTANAGWAVFLGLALLNHEGAIVTAPWLAFLAAGRRPGAMKLMQVVALLVLASAPAMLYHQFLISHGLMPMSEGYYFRWKKVVGTLALSGEYLAFGIFEGFKLFWFFPIAAMIAYAGERRYYELAAMCLLVGGALSQFLFVSDISRLVGIAFPAILIGMNECRRQLKNFRSWAWGIFCFNIFVPQFYVAQSQAIPLSPLPVKLLMGFLLIQLRPNMLPHM